jgi:hypothetical protein
MSKVEKVFDQEFTARNFSTTPLTISGLQGDTYDYELVMFYLPVNVVAGDYPQITLNSDTTANYRSYAMRGFNTTTQGTVSDVFTYAQVGFVYTATPQMSITKITGSSGDERYLDIFCSGHQGTYYEVDKRSAYWKNTVDEVDEITISNGVSLGTQDAHIILYRTPKAASQAKWELMETQTFTASSADQTFSGLNGDRDIQYKIEVQANSDQYRLRVNNDSGSNYINQRLYNANGSISAANSPGTSALPSTGLVYSTFIINTETGTERLIDVSGAGTSNNQQVELASWYTNTVTNVTSLVITNLSSSTGTAKLYRRINPTTTADTLNFETIETVDISGDFSAGHTFSGLTGDSTTLYKIEGLFDTVGNDLRLQIDGDTGSNYTDQYLKGVSGADSAAASGSIAYQLLCDASASKVANFEYYIYSPSGENRPSLLRVAHGEDSVEYKAGWWLDSASEISSFKVYASSTTTCTGTLKLSRLI